MHLEKHQFKELITQIERTKDLHHLKALHHQMFAFLKAATLSEQSIVETYNQLNNLHDALMKKAVLIAEKAMVEEPSPHMLRPKAFCFYLLGSGARGEQTIWTDQDNGIIYECTPENSRLCKNYINSLAKKVTFNLNEMGYPYCSGNVMATNPRWSQPTDEWITKLKSYIDTCNPEDIQFLYIAADLRPLYGQPQLITQLQLTYLQLINRSDKALERLQAHNRLPKVPIGIFGQIHKERWGTHSGTVNIKTSLYVPIVNSIKFLAIKHSIQATSTMTRIEELCNKGIITERIYQKIKHAFHLSLYYRLLSSIGEEENTNYIGLEKLSKDEKKTLKAAMKFVKHWQSELLHWNGVLKNE